MKKLVHPPRVRRDARRGRRWSTLAAPAGAATPVLADDKFKWFYWIGFAPRARASSAWLIAMAVGYYVRVLRPK